MHKIYKFTNLINSKVYVGLTNNVKVRLASHGSKRSNSYISKALRKYGIDNFKFEILETVGTLEEANIREMYFISKFGSYGNGYNLTRGGSGTKREIIVTEGQCKQILNDPCSSTVASEKYGIKYGTVLDIRNGHSWNDIERPDIRYDNDTCCITEDIAILILDDKRSPTALSKELGISFNIVSNIRSGRTWKHLDRINQIVYEKGGIKLSEKEVIEIIGNNDRAEDVAKKYGISSRSVYDIRSGNVWSKLDRSEAPGHYASNLRKISFETEKLIIKSKESSIVLSKNLGIPVGTIYNIRNLKGNKEHSDARFKLDEISVKNIIESKASNITMANKYEMTVQAIRAIRSGKTWKHVDRSSAPDKYNKHRRNKNV